MTNYTYIDDNIKLGIYDIETAAKEALKCYKRLRKPRKIVQLENWIKKNPKTAVGYSKLIGKRLEEDVEDLIIKEGSVKNICEYALFAIKGRWKQAENKIIQKGESSDLYFYATKIIKNRWIECEEKLIKLYSKNCTRENFYFYSSSLFQYLQTFFNHVGWHEAEKVICQSADSLRIYAEEILGDALPEDLHNMMILYSFSSDKNTSESAKKYLKFYKQTREDLVRKIKKFDENMTIKQLIDKLEN